MTDGKPGVETNFTLSSAVFVEEKDPTGRIVNSWFLTRERARGLYAGLGDHFGQTLIDQAVGDLAPEA